MYSFPQRITPAFESQIETHLSFVSEVFNHLITAAQKLFVLNMQVARTVLDETVTNAQQLIDARNPNELISATAAQAQPATEKALAYQQHINNIVANTQAEVAKVARDHVAHSTRTAIQVTEEIARKVAEEQQGAVRQAETAASKAAGNKSTRREGEDGASERHAHADNGSGNSHDEHKPSPLLGALLDNLEEPRTE